MQVKILGSYRFKHKKPTKLVNLVTRLRGEAYSFYKSCTQQQRGSYTEMAAALTKRLTPVTKQADQSGLFHERKQGEKGSVNISMHRLCVGCSTLTRLIPVRNRVVQRQRACVGLCSPSV